MPAPAEILSGFTKIQDKPYGTRFFLADLHFHTPSSSDGRGKDKYGFNPYGVSYKARSKVAGADMVSDLKGFDSLKALKDRTDIHKLDLKDLEVLENKVLNDLFLLGDIKELKTIRDPAGRKDLAEQKEVNKFSLQLSYVPSSVLMKDDSLPTERDTAFYYFKLQVVCPENNAQTAGDKTALYYGLDSFLILQSL
jgi:hypothetical protein